MEFYYRRAETVRKGRVVPARTQTVVIFLPDVRSCIPTRVEWDDLNAKYKRRLDSELKKPVQGSDDISSSKMESKDEKVIDNSGLKVIDEVGEDSCNEGNRDPEIHDEQNDLEQMKEDISTVATEMETSGTAAMTASTATDIEKALHTIITLICH